MTTKIHNKKQLQTKLQWPGHNFREWYEAHPLEAKYSSLAKCRREFEHRASLGGISFNKLFKIIYSDRLEAVLSEGSVLMSFVKKESSAGNKYLQPVKLHLQPGTIGNACGIRDEDFENDGET